MEASVTIQRHSKGGFFVGLAFSGLVFLFEMGKLSVLEASAAHAGLIFGSQFPFCFRFRATFRKR